MIDFKIDPINNKLIIPLVIVQGAERIAQSISIHLKTWIGEWFLDTSHGVPYLQRVLIKNPKSQLVESVLRAEILKVSGVRSIKTFNMDVDLRARKSKINYEVESSEGLISGIIII